MKMRSVFKSTFFLISIALVSITSAFSADTITGKVRNRTTNRPSAGDEVVLLRLGEGMEEAARTRTGPQGAFSLPLANPGAQHIVRVLHQGVNYDQKVTGAGRQEIAVFDSVQNIPGLSGNLGIAQVESDGSALKVTEMYTITNLSSPPVTQVGPQNFAFSLPAKASLESFAVKKAGGIWVNVKPVPMTGNPGRYALDFPLRPGDTLFKYSYHLPYEGPTTLRLKLAYPIQSFAVVHPLSMSFKASRAQAFTSPGLVRGLRLEEAVSKPLVGEVPAFEISGLGTAPPSTVAKAPSPFVPPIAAHDTQSASLHTLPDRSANGVWAWGSAIAAIFAAGIFGVWRRRRGGTMRTTYLGLLLGVVISSVVGVAAQDGSSGVPLQGGDFSSNPEARKVPPNVILVKGAAPSASDTVTPRPEDSRITEKTYLNLYFGLGYSLPASWRQKYLGPPPSDSGYYVLAQIEPAKTSEGPNRGTILISAQDLFFDLATADSTLALVKFKHDRLGADFRVERPPTVVKIANHTFVRMDYMSPVAELHWYTLATQIRCHAVEFTLTSRDPALLENLVHSMDNMALPPEAGAASGKGGGDSPVCVKDYATKDNVVHRVEPVLIERKFNPIPVRIIIDKYGKVKHIHVISAFPDQAKAITDALLQWEFRPYKLNGQPVEVETGIMFGASPQLRQNQRSAARAAE